MLIVTLKLTVTRLRQQALPLWLCLALSGGWCLMSRSVAGQTQIAGAQTASTETKEAERLN
ncbi:MAG TPA: hypothetical protein VF064_18145, partial [Pyrinomonadaceae bacterium]